MRPLYILLYNAFFVNKFHAFLQPFGAIFLTFLQIATLQSATTQYRTNLHPPPRIFATERTVRCKNPALAMALLQHLSIKQGKNVSVMMPYADSLKYVADWYCQLWGESLGKEKDVDGNIVNVGQTPLKCLGATILWQLGARK